MQERVSCPGWLRGSRFRDVERTGRYLLLYEAESIAAFDSAAYYERLRNPTPLSQAIFPRFRNTWRTVCSVEGRRGHGLFPALAALRIPQGSHSPDDGVLLGDAARVDRLVGRREIGQAATTEKQLRGQADRQIDRAVLAFFWSVDRARIVRDRQLPDGELLALRHSVARCDLDLAGG